MSNDTETTNQEPKSMTDGCSIAESQYDFDGTKNHWGYMIESQWGTKRQKDGGWKVQGCFTPRVKVGDRVKLKDGIYVFTEVENKNNPRDAFFGYIKPVI